jgi:hypothetical protein
MNITVPLSIILNYVYRTSLKTLRYMFYLVHLPHYMYDHRIYQVCNELPCNFKIIIKSRFDLLMSYEDYNSI